jgi:hypothetical protein
MPSYRTLFEVSWIKGLITEASELTHPEQATVDELNLTLDRSNSRRRRLAAKLETGSTASSETYGDSVVFTVHDWENVGGEANVEFDVVQAGSKLRFYDKASENLSDGEVPISTVDSNPYILDMSTFNRLGGLGASQAPIQVASVKGSLVVVSPEINSFYITRDATTKAFTATQISFKARDYDWVGDTSTYFVAEARDSTDATTLNWAREYDTRNAGWANDAAGGPLATYYTQSNYPPLSLPWHAGKNASDNYANAEFNKLADEGFNSLIGNGHFILDLYTGDRAENFTFDSTTYPLSDIEDNLANKPEDTRFSCVAAYSGRVFYAGMASEANSSRVYYSQSLTTIGKLGDVHTINDPTAEFFNDPLDTDGGFVDIEDAYGIKVLYPMGNTLMIFAENGIWALDGVDGVFRSTEYRLNDVTDVGIASPQSFGAVDGAPFWWNDTGIYVIGRTQLGDPSVEDLSRTTIQTFFNNVDRDAKDQVRAVVDGVDKRILWFYPDNGGTDPNDRKNVLIFDAVLGAFYPWKVETSTATPIIIDGSFYRGSAAQESVVNVLDNDGNIVVDNLGVNVTVSALVDFTGSPKVNLLCYNTDGSLQWGEFSGTDFLDWGTENYSSFLESRHNLGGDLVLKKQAPYIVVYLGVTETGWTANSGGGYSPTRESSAFVSTYWDWKTTPACRIQQAYRFKRPPVVDDTDLSSFNYPYTVMQTRLKLRGRGRSSRVRVESEQGKDFELIGWGMVGAANDRW